MYARRHFVSDQPAATYEELDGQYAAVVKVREHTLEIARGALLPASRPEGCAGKAQHACSVDVATQRVHGDLSAHAAGTDDRHFALEGHELLVEEWHAAELCPGTLNVRAAADDRLPFAVVAHVARLEHPGHADRGHGARELRAGVDGRPARRRDLQMLEQAFLLETVLAGRERGERRAD